MKRPLFNMQERWEMKEDSALTAIRKLRLAVLHLRREIHRDLLKLFSAVS
jgi:hypothetical protein